VLLFKKRTLLNWKEEVQIVFRAEALMHFGKKKKKQRKSARKGLVRGAGRSFWCRIFWELAVIA